MLKLMPIIMGILTTATIAQPSLAMNPINNSANPIVDRPSEDLQAQLVINVGGFQSRRDLERRRYLERERERERQIERQRWEAKHSRFSTRERERHQDRYEYRHRR
jgi:hypothetical protein